MPNLTRRSFLQSSLIAGGALSAAAQTGHTNFVMLYCDDLGYGDPHTFGGAIPTPNLDRMASEGIRCMQHLSASPVCSPSRAGLLTGRYPTRVNVPRVLNPNDAEGMDTSVTTLAKCLKGAGYNTQCIGKWHLGRPAPYLPTHFGFDSYFGVPYSNDMTPAVNHNPAAKMWPPLPLMRDEQIVETDPDQRYLTRRYTEEALKFIQRSRNDPFFLYLPYSQPHDPAHASEKFRGSTKQGVFGDSVAEIDWSAGEILNALKQQGLDRNTLVIFSSDNGPWFQGSTGGFRGRKGMTNEGGMRVPFIARKPGWIPAGKTCNSLTSMMDIYPTVAKLCGASLPKGETLDGIDIAPLLTGKAQTLDREALLYFDNWNIQAARHNQWKLHVSRWNVDFYNPAPAGGKRNFPLQKPELYDILGDRDESYDVAEDHPDIVKDLQARIEKLVPTFPEPVRKAWADTNARGNLEWRPGAYGRPLPASQQ